MTPKTLPFGDQMFSVSASHGKVLFTGRASYDTFAVFGSIAEVQALIAALDAAIDAARAQQRGMPTGGAQ